MDEEISIYRNDDESRYVLTVDGDIAGVVEYDNDGETITLTHTEVDPSYGGRGIGSKLAEFVLADVASEEMPVSVECEFLRGYIDKHPEYAEILND